MVNHTVMWPLWSIYIIWLFLYTTRVRNTQWLLSKWNELVLSWRMWREFPVHICLKWLPDPSSWILVIKRQSYYQSCKTKNCWHSVDAHFRDGVASVSQSPLPLKASNTLFMTVCNQSPPRLPRIHDQQSLTLRWRSFSGHRRAHVSLHFDHWGSQ